MVVEVAPLYQPQVEVEEVVVPLYLEAAAVEVRLYQHQEVEVAAVVY
jgi:hypothetical protein